MKIAFRMDDITPDMDWKSFEAFEQLFERYGCYPLLGIVPDNLCLLYTSPSPRDTR